MKKQSATGEEVDVSPKIAALQAEYDALKNQYKGEEKAWLGGGPERLAREGDAACPEGEPRAGRGLTRR